MLFLPLVGFTGIAIAQAVPPSLGNDGVSVPGVIVPVTSFGARCDWNGTTGTDDTAAFNAAWASIASKGGEIDLPARRCFVPNGLNLSSTTPQYGNTRVIRGQGKMQSQIVTRNANIGIDLGGVTGIKLADFELTDVGTTPRFGIARYRAAVSNACGGHEYEHIAVLGSYTGAALYSIACEVNTARDMDIYQYGSGVGISIDQSNCLNMTGQGVAIISAGSDTVNHFYSGMVLADQATSGNGVFFCKGSADDVVFDGTYFVAVSGKASIQFGQSISDYVQGTKTLHSVRFEGQGDAIQINSSGVGPLTIDGGTTFGELAPGIDIDQVNTSVMPGAGGLEGADIHGNSHLGRGMRLTAVTNSHISVAGVFGRGSSKTTITIPDHGFISESTVQADDISWGRNTATPGSVIIQNDNVTATGSLKVLYGPKSPTDPYGSAGSVVVMQPFGTAPSNPDNGELAMADCKHWIPVKGCSAQTLVQWNASESVWDVVGTLQEARSTPRVTTGAITGTDAGGYVSGLSSVTSLTITFVDSGWAAWASCTANATEPGIQPYVSSQLGLNTSVTFSFPSPYTGGITYNCNGN